MYVMEKGKSAIKIVSYVIAGIAALTVAAGLILCAVFPNKYAREVNAAADRFGLDRSFVRAVVWAESGFDKNAVSKKGAVGLMQIMPYTLIECAAALGIQNPDATDVETSLFCGCYYMSELLKKFSGEKKYALMAYNAGETNARLFIKGAEVFPETKNYLKRVERAETVYGLFD